MVLLQSLRDLLGHRFEDRGSAPACALADAAAAALEWPWGWGEAGAFDGELVCGNHFDICGFEKDVWFVVCVRIDVCVCEALNVL